jgi:hypothetical protein
MPSRLVLALAAVALTAASCGGANGSPASDGRSDREADEALSSPAGWETDFTKHSVPLGEFASGGPGKDGIPSIEAPRFVTPETADEWLEAREPVIELELGDDARAYPIQILMWHEIVNDEID